MTLTLIGVKDSPPGYQMLKFKVLVTIIVKILRCIGYQNLT